MVDAAGPALPAVFLAAAHLELVGLVGLVELVELVELVGLVGLVGLVSLAEELLAGGTLGQNFVCLRSEPYPVGEHNFFFFTAGADGIGGDVEQ